MNYQATLNVVSMWHVRAVSQLRGLTKKATLKIAVHGASAAKAAGPAVRPSSAVSAMEHTCTGQQRLETA